MPSLTQVQVDHFNRQGFLLIPNMVDDEGMERIITLMESKRDEWSRREWPKGVNQLACWFMMLGETMLALPEKEEYLAIARQILESDEIRIGACGMGESIVVISSDGRPRRQVQWHADGNPGEVQVAFRTALDRHDMANAPLRILPGSHVRDREEVRQELLNIELAGGSHKKTPDLLFAVHPHEVEVVLDPGWTLVWNPNCWHATGEQTGLGPRRTFGWNFVKLGGRVRDVGAISAVHGTDWHSWNTDRQTLWGLKD